MAVEPKRDALACFGVAIIELQDVDATAIGGVVGGQLYEGGRRS
jgi:hypothetical protein